MREKCDKCHSDILMGRCSCGEWFDIDKQPKYAKILEEAIEVFNKSGSEILGGDHFSGSCFVFFKGDHEKCKKVSEYIRTLNQ